MRGEEGRGEERREEESSEVLRVSLRPSETLTGKSYKCSVLSVALEIHVLFFCVQVVMVG